MGGVIRVTRRAKGGCGMKTAMKMEILPTGVWVTNCEDDHTFDAGLARAISHMLIHHETLLDVGCGLGAYVEAYRAAGIIAYGIDGNPHTSERPHCSTQDITGDLVILPETPFAFVTCLEVMEHIPQQYERMVAERLAKWTTEYLILSWADVGQAGKGHVNCKRPAKVKELMKRVGLTLAGGLTAFMKSQATVSWLKSNIMVFAK